MIYGHNGTIHHTEYVDVEVDEKGNVVSVWFRCMALPFKQSSASSDRAHEMRKMYESLGDHNRLVAVEIIK